MGRPEKAKIRKLTGSPSIIFPVGEEGGRFRSVNEAANKVGTVKGEFPFNYCKKCERETIYRKCENCGEKTEKKYYCRICSSEVDGKCNIHEIGVNYKFGRIDMKHYFDKAREKLGLLKVEMPQLIKGVRGTSSKNHDIENLSLIHI